MGDLTPQQKQTRRTNAAEHDAYENATLTWLIEMVTGIEEDLNLTGTPTLAIGYYSPADEIWICSKGAGSKDAILDIAENNRPRAKRKSILRTTDMKGGNFENMHAEMQIVNNVVRYHELNYKVDLAGQLVIACAPNKPVCMDCCGWMARKNIPHGETCGDRSNQGWRHPVTKSGFRGDGPNLQHTRVAK